MEDRRDAHVAIVLPNHRPGFRSGIRKHVEIGGQNALGRAGRARGVDDRLDIPRLDRAFQRIECIAADRVEAHHRQADVGRHAVCHDDELLQIGAIDLAQPLDQIGMHDHHLGTGIGDDMRQQIAAVGSVERHEDRAEIIDRIESDQRVAPAWQPGRNIIALAHAELLQARRLVDDAAAQFGIAPFLAIFEDDVGLFRPFACPAIDQIAQHAFVAIGNARIAKVARTRQGRRHGICLPKSPNPVAVTPGRRAANRLRQPDRRPSRRSVCCPDDSNG